jgi:hypothetical protein
VNDDDHRSCIWAGPRDGTTCRRDRPRQSTLVVGLRRSTARICRYAGLLVTELGSYRPLVGHLEDAVRHVEARTGHMVDEELFARLLDRLGVTDVDLALERLQEARPDV